MPAGLGPHPGKVSPGLWDTFPFTRLQLGIQLGIQLQAWWHWGLGKDLAKPEEEQSPEQHLALPASSRAMHKFSHQPPVLRPAPPLFGGLC